MTATTENPQEKKTFRFDWVPALSIALTIFGIIGFVGGREYTWCYFLDYGVMPMQFSLPLQDVVFIGYEVLLDGFFSALLIALSWLLITTSFRDFLNRLVAWIPAKWIRSAAVSLALAALGIFLLAGVAGTASERAATRVREEKAAFEAWDREKMGKLGMHFTIIERADKDAKPLRLCGITVQASERTAAVYDGRALQNIQLDAAIKRHQVISLETNFDEAIRLAACECHAQVPSKPSCPESPTG